MSEIIKKLRQNLPEITRRFQEKSLLLFGSYVRASQRKRSDLDILVKFVEPHSFFEFLALERYLGDLLGIKVDLVMKEALRHWQAYPAGSHCGMKAPREYLDYFQDIQDALLFSAQCAPYQPALARRAFFLA